MSKPFEITVEAVYVLRGRGVAVAGTHKGGEIRTGDKAELVGETGTIPVDEVRVELQLTPEGLVRARTLLTNTGDAGLSVVAVRTGLPVPHQATELLDLTGRGPFTLDRLRGGVHRHHRSGEDQFVLDQFDGPQLAVIGHQQRLVSRRQRSLFRFIANQAEPLHDIHRQQESLQAALADQRQLGIDAQLDVGHLQRVAIEIEREAYFAFGVGQTVP